MLVHGRRGGDGAGGSAMKHAGRDALARLEPFLAELRKRRSLQEKRPGSFYLASRAFLHFHEDPDGLFADVKFANDFSRHPVSKPAQRKQLLRRIDRFLVDRCAPAAPPGSRSRS